ncbi:hypothetical protein D7Y21_28025 [Corallococcus sp. AB045]|nr:hypothetical protein D7Y21_28025 [Corallococcus sp. AB045]
MRSQMLPRLRRSGLALQVVLLLCLVAAPVEVLAQKLCFRDITGLPGTPAAPTTDGTVDGDPGWNNAFRYRFGNGTDMPHAAVQGLRSDTHLYLSFEVNNDPSFDTSDVIVLAFSTGRADGFHRVLLYPLPPAVGNVKNSIVGGIDYFTGTRSGGTVTWGQKIHNPSFITARLATSGAATSLKSWSVEMQLEFPNESCCEFESANNSCCGSFDLPLQGDFGFFVAILQVDSKGTPVEDDDDAVPFPWPPRPPGKPDLDPWDVETTTPPPNEWGLANLGGSGCGGLSFKSTDIKSNNKTDSLINLTPGSENIFSVDVKNDSASPAEQVSPTFKIANFGIVDPNFGPWAALPAPLPPPKNIPGNTPSTTFKTGPWILSTTERAQYQTHPHQCIYVELDANPGPGKVVNFVNRSAYRNMDFGEEASVFERTATIDTRGFSQRIDEKPLPGCKPVYRMELVTSPTVREQIVSTPDGVQHQEEMSLLYHGYLQTKRIIRIKEKDYRVKLPVASYGYNVVHSRPATEEEKRSAQSGEKPMVAQKEFVGSAREPFKPEELIPGQHWNVATTLQDSSRPPTPPNCPGLKVTIPPAGRPGEGPKSQVITMEIPQDEAVLLGTRAEYQDKPTQPPLSGCGCKRAGQTAGSTAMLGLLALGFLSNRRRRGKNE